MTLLLFVGVVQMAGAAHGAQGVNMEKSRFVPKDLTVPRGETVTWTNMDSVGHSVVADDGSFNSNPSCGGVGGSCMKQGESFSHTFAQPGRVAYHCAVHGAAGGGGMAGTITVT